MKAIKLIVFLLGVIVLFACETQDQITDDSVVLLDLNDKNKNEIISSYEDVDITIYFIEEDVNGYLDGEFVRYGYGFETGDVVVAGSTVYIFIASGKEEIVYYEPISIKYDGPRLSDDFKIEPFLDNNDTSSDYLYIPTGGYYEVELNHCVDGDTASFVIPSKLQDKLGYYRSTRFLNMDTEESTRTKEEWGKPASVYTCDLLTNAESIVLQTDSGDNYVDKYDRLLSWVWIIPKGEEEYELVNYKVLQQGLGQVAYLYGAGNMEYKSKSYTNWMFQAENYSISESLGMHGNLPDRYWDYENNEPLF